MKKFFKPNLKWVSVGAIGLLLLSSGTYSDGSKDQKTNRTSSVKAATSVACDMGDLSNCSRQCDEGNGDSCSHLGVMYVTGNGVDQDKVKGGSGDDAQFSVPGNGLSQLPAGDAHAHASLNNLK